MVKIHLVRHGEAEAGFGDHRDPGLNVRGHTQARKTAESLRDIGPLEIRTSPLIRTQETAKYLAELWNVTPEIDNRFAEIPSPIKDLTDRARWLHNIMADSWRALPDDTKRWRNRMIDAALSLPHDCVIFSHFIAINVLVGSAQNRSELISFRPDNASVTVLDSSGTTLDVVSLGREATTRVN